MRKGEEAEGWRRDGCSEGLCDARSSACAGLLIGCGGCLSEDLGFRRC